jgi:hypothetical protein
MSERGVITEKPEMNWRLKVGIGIFLLSILVPIAGIPLVATLGFTSTLTTTISGVLLAGAEVLGITAVAVMGKPGYNYIKSHFLAILKRYGPTDQVSRLRYRIGLIMFCLPILFGWITPYVGNMIPGFSLNPLPYAIIGDTLLLVSFFVLGGQFWDKIHSLFVKDAFVQFPKLQNSTQES